MCVGVRCEKSQGMHVEREREGVGERGEERERERETLR